MLRFVTLWIAVFMVSAVSLAQNSENSSKIWRLNEEGKLQCSHNEGQTWGGADANVESRLNAFHFVNSNDGWAVGHNATVLHWDGEKWGEVLIFSTANLLSVYFQDAKNGWAAGSNGTLLFWDGTSWTEEVSPTTETLTNVKRTITGNLQITAQSGAIFEKENGQWKAHTAPIAPVHSASLSKLEE